MLLSMVEISYEQKREEKLIKYQELKRNVIISMLLLSAGLPKYLLGGVLKIVGTAVASRKIGKEIVSLIKNTRGAGLADASEST